MRIIFKNIGKLKCQGGSLPAVIGCLKPYAAWRKSNIPITVPLKVADQVALQWNQVFTITGQGNVCTRHDIDRLIRNPYTLLCISVYSQDNAKLSFDGELSLALIGCSHS